MVGPRDWLCPFLDEEFNEQYESYVFKILEGLQHVRHNGLHSFHAQYLTYQD